MKKIIAQITVALAMAVLMVPAIAGANTVSVPLACVGITMARNLVVGSMGQDVRCLQALLNMSSTTQISTLGAGSPGLETTYFGQRTLMAVRIWQAQQGWTPANQIGPMSRAKLNAWLGPIVSNTNITITSLSPSAGPSKTQITIMGNNFSSAFDGNTVLFDGIDAGKATVINGGAALSYMIPEGQPEVCPQGPPMTVTNCDPPALANGNHTIAIKTAGGTSNTVLFMVTGASY